MLESLPGGRKARSVQGKTGGGAQQLVTAAVRTQQAPPCITIVGEGTRRLSAHLLVICLMIEVGHTCNNWLSAYTSVTLYL